MSSLSAQEFSQVFLLDLHAIDARRRRWRLEQILGQMLPECQRLAERDGGPPPPAARQVEAPNADGGGDLNTLRQEVKKARRAYEDSLAPPKPVTKTSVSSANPTAPPEGAPAPVAVPPANPPAAQVSEPTLSFHQHAYRWLQAAKRFRDEKFRQALAAAPGEAAKAAVREWEQAERETAAAVNAYSTAAYAQAAPTETSPSPQTRTTALREETPEALAYAYYRLLVVEEEARMALETCCLTGVPTDQPVQTPASAQPAAYEAVCRARVELIQAEQNLYREVPRVDRGDLVQTLESDLQRAIRALHQVQLNPKTEAAAPTENLLESARRQALDLDLVGMAFSGGGIRSATFALGVLQGLAQLRLLGCFDYLSTVSGGGYIGAWFAAWVKREQALGNVERQLSPNRVSQADARREVLPQQQVVDDEPEPVRHLREFSRYLAPRFSPFSVDTWTLLTAYLRNLVINSLLFAPVAAAAVLFSRLLVWVYQRPTGNTAWTGLWTNGGWCPKAPVDLTSASVWLTLGMLATLLIASICIFIQREALYREAARPSSDHPPRPAGWSRWALMHFGVLLMLLIAAFCGAWVFGVAPETVRDENGTLLPFAQTTLRHLFYGELNQSWAVLPGAVRFLIAFVLLVAVGSAAVRTVSICIRTYVKKKHSHSWGWTGYGNDVVLAAGFGLCLFLILRGCIWPISLEAAHAEDPKDAVLWVCLLLTVGPPLFLLAAMLGSVLDMALLGKWLSDADREWRSRVTAYLLLGSVLWLAFFGATLWLPWVVEYCWHWYLPSIAVSAWAVISAAGAWLARRPPARRSEAQPSGLQTVLINLAAIVFLTGLIAGVSWIATLCGDSFDPSLQGADFLVRSLAHPLGTALATVICLAVGGVFLIAIPVNRYSLHSLYANRLVRCYLGASRYKSTWDDRKGAPPSPWKAGPGGAPTNVPPAERSRPNWFTGFDGRDDLPLTDLQIVRRPGNDRRVRSYFGPYHLVNTALNLVAGRDLATQDRKATAFVLAPDYCGSNLTGYAMAQPPGADPLTLGRAIAISGAAVDPNMNVLQSGGTTALLTLLNARLGWWLANPMRADAAKGWEATEPLFANQLFLELLGLTNESRNYVHLSDGGHFENLGVYELIRRRCRYIIVVDAGTDRVAASDNMAALLQLVRTDFGVNIELEPSVLQMTATTGYSPWHCAVGRIRYDEVDDRAVPGMLLYLQATLTGDEPPDLLQYAARNPAFPRQSTANQFFDETQFECYRALGHHVATQVFADAASRWTGRARDGGRHQEEVRALFSELRRQWFPPPPCTPEELRAASEAAMNLDESISRAAGLTGFNIKMYPEIDYKLPVPPAPGAQETQESDIRELRAVSKTLQVMEAAWAGVKLNQFHSHPTNRGWMNTFRRWTTSPIFHKYWPVLRAEYSEAFVRFCERSLNLEPTRVQDDQVTAPGGVFTPKDAADLAMLSKEFLQEWAEDIRDWTFVVPKGKPNMATAMAQFATDPVTAMARFAVADAALVSATPFIWLLRQGPTSDELRLPQPVTYGVVIAWRTSDEEANLFVWLRGAYRTLGIGTQIVSRCVQTIADDALAFRTTAAPPLRRLVVCYPLLQGGIGARLEQGRWMTFFFGQGFRRERQPDTGPGSNLLVLKRELYGAG